VATARRWTRYGHDRVYVTDDDGAKVGYLDLKTGLAHIALVDRSDVFDAAVEPYRENRVQQEQVPDPPVRALSDSAEHAGASLQVEYDKRMARREARVTQRFPRIGKLLLAVFDEAPSTRAFKQGAEGERRAVKRLLSDSGDETLILLNRKLGKGRRDGDIDVLAITPAGIRIIDVKHYRDAKVSVERTGGLFSERVDCLKVRGRDATHLIDKMAKQTDAVRTAIAGSDQFSEVSVEAALCFVDAVLPTFSTPVVNGVGIRGPKRTAAWLRESTGGLTQEDREQLWALLDAALPPATASF
jgi:hypothetical protein